MDTLDEYLGHPFPVSHKDVGESCIDYWFDATEVAEQTRNNPLVPTGFTAIARTPNDDLLLQDESEKVHYCLHESGEVIKLADSMKSFVATINVS